MNSTWTPDTIIGLLRDALAEDPETPASFRPGRRRVPEHHWDRRTLWERAARLAKGLDALGVRPGEPVLLLSENHPRWLQADLALLGLGAPDVPRGVEAPPDEIAFIIGKVGARVAFFETARHLDKAREHLGDVEHLILFYGSADDVDESMRSRVHTFESLEDDGPTDDVVAWFNERVETRTGDEVATIVFTSGTTGQPKGVVLTQANLASNVHQALDAIGFLRSSRDVLSILPPWHMLERLVEYALLALQIRIVYTDRRHLTADFKTFHPEIMVAVPRLWVMLQEGVQSKLREAPKARRILAETALRLGSTWARAQRVWHQREAAFPRQTPPKSRWSALPALALWPLVWIARRVVLNRLAEAIGIDRLTHGAAISGGGALPEHVDLFFESLGISILNGYGLTETSPLLAIRVPNRNIVGTVGPPVAKTEFRVRDLESGKPLDAGSQGVILARGPQVMRGYHDEPDATRRVLDDEGWFDTGDLGRLTEGGELMITGRAKDTIVLLSGENIEPEPLENALTQSEFIQQAIVVGQDRKFLGALIVPNRDDTRIEELTPDQLNETLTKEVRQHVNPERGFRPYERIVNFHILDEPFSREDGSMSQTLKLKRDIIHTRLKESIDKLFGDAR